MAENTSPRFSRLWQILIVIALVLGVTGGVVGALSLGSGGEKAVQRGTSNVPIHFEQGGASLVVGSGGTVDVQSGGILTLSADFFLRSSGSITPTDGGVLTPTAELTTLTPAGALGTALGVCTTGSKTILYNSVNANVVITDTGNGILAGNQTIGQFDALPLSCIGSKWVQTGPVSAN